MRNLMAKSFYLSHVLLFEPLEGFNWAKSLLDGAKPTVYSKQLFVKLTGVQTSWLQELKIEFIF